MARGSFFGDAKNPKPVWSIGQPGESGNVQIVDMLFSQQRPVQGAILLQWNLQASCPGKSGLWSTNFRIGGSKGTNQSPSNCLQLTDAVDRPECQVAFLSMHITPYGSLYIENVWIWTADHYLDYPEHFQIDVFNARSFLIESQGPVWMYGTASEHSVLYQYHFVNAKNIFCGQLQTETAYFQTNPPAPTPFKSLPTWSDPIFDACPTNDSFCAKGWGVDIINGTNIYIYNAGIYSFFQEWSTTCIGTPHNRYCQDAIFRIRGSTDQVYVWNLQTVGVENMVEVDDTAKVKSKDNISVFADSILGYLPKV